MKKIITTAIFTILLITFSGTVFAKDPVTYQTQNVKFSGGTRTVNAVYVNMNDKTIRVESQAAKNQIGQTDDFKNIVAQAKDSNTEVVAAINGTFFNSYTDMKPGGTMQNDGKFNHLTNVGSVIAFSSDNKVSVESLRTSIKGAINEDWEDYNYTWYAWNINNMNDDKNSIIIFDPAFGKFTPKHDRTSIIVDNRKVTDIKKGQVEIPANGYVIVLQDQNYIKKFHVGDTVDYKIETSKQTSVTQKTSIDWSNIVTTVGAGPTLLKNGTILANGKAEGFTEDKININRSQRSFAGVTRDNTLIIGTVANVNVKELAEICKNMGMMDAINLDGGASSALYYNGKVVTSPGRKLSNAMVITRVKTVPPRYSFNGKEVISPNGVYTDASSKELMVPLKDTCNLLYANFSVKGSDITVKRYSKTIILKVGSSTVDIDGKDVSLKAAPVLKNGVVYVPVQAFIDALGGSVSYDTAKDMYKVTVTNINIPDLARQAQKAYTDMDYAAAKKLFNQLLTLDPKYSRAYYYLGYIAIKEKNPIEEIKNFEEYLKYDSRNAEIMTYIAWAYGSKQDIQTQIKYFEKALAVEPTNSGRWISLGQINMYYSVQNYNRAIECFNNALKNKPTAEQKAQAEKLIKQCKQKLESQ